MVQTECGNALFDGSKYSSRIEGEIYVSFIQRRLVPIDSKESVRKYIRQVTEQITEEVFKDITELRTMMYSVVSER